MSGPAQDTLKKRYAYKLTANAFSMGIGAVTQAVIPRGLGPAAYGDLNFLTSFFTRVTSFTDMGTSLAFYTKLSQRQRETGLVSFYMRYAGGVCAAILAAASLCLLTPLRSSLWPGQGGLYVLMAAALACLLWICTVLGLMADAYGATVQGEISKMVQKCAGLLLLGVLLALGLFDLRRYFLSQYAVYAAFVGCLAAVMFRRGHLGAAGWRLERDSARGYAREFYEYSSPLFWHATTGLVTGILDRWLLQVYGGNVQQGFFGLSSQIGAICFLFPGAMTPLLTREFSIAHGESDLPKMAALFRRHIPLLYAVAAYFSCFVAVEADRMIGLMGGAKYEAALGAVVIMSLSPLHQTYGQLSGGVFYATGQTRLYRNIGMTFMALGLPVTYFLLAPRGNGGLGAGATGLAAKTLAMSIIAVNVQLYYNSSFLKLPFWKYLAHQVASAGALLTLAICARHVADRLPGGSLVAFLAGGALYTALVAAAGWFFPLLFGLSRQDMRDVLSQAHSRFRRLLPAP